MTALTPANLPALSLDELAAAFCQSFAALVAGHSQKEAAKRLGISQPYISQIKNGVLPSMEKALRLARPTFLPKLAGKALWNEEGPLYLALVEAIQTRRAAAQVADFQTAAAPFVAPTKAALAKFTAVGALAPTDSSQLFGALLREARGPKTRPALAEILGCTQTYIYLIETQRSKPSRDTAVLWSERLAAAAAQDPTLAWNDGLAARWKTALIQLRPAGAKTLRRAWTPLDVEPAAPLAQRHIARKDKLAAPVVVENASVPLINDLFFTRTADTQGTLACYRFPEPGEQRPVTKVLRVDLSPLPPMIKAFLENLALATTWKTIAQETPALWKQEGQTLIDEAQASWVGNIRPQRTTEERRWRHHVGELITAARKHDFAHGDARRVVLSFDDFAQASTGSSVFKNAYLWQKVEAGLSDVIPTVLYRDALAELDLKFNLLYWKNARGLKKAQTATRVLINEYENFSLSLTSPDAKPKRARTAPETARFWPQAKPGQR